MLQPRGGIKVVNARHERKSSVTQRDKKKQKMLQPRGEIEVINARHEHDLSVTQRDRKKKKESRFYITC